MHGWSPDGQVHYKRKMIKSIFLLSNQVDQAERQLAKCEDKIYKYYLSVYRKARYSQHELTQAEFDDAMRCLVLIKKSFQSKVV